MRLFDWMQRRGSAPIARDRLKVLLAHERTLGASSELLGLLREDILALICRRLTVTPEHIQVKMSRGASLSTLAIDIEIPS
jgi:cell division topological specificity factor